MDKRNKISFIPRKPISRKTRAVHRPMSLKIFLSFIVFLITLVVYGGMFFYQKNLDKSFKNEQLKLSSAKQKLDPNNTIENVQKFQKRTMEIKKLLGSHIAPSIVFNLIQDITLKSIKFTSFQFSTKKLTIANKNVKKQTLQTNFFVNLKGIAPSYSSVAYQLDVIRKEVKSKNGRIKSFVVSGISLGKEGNVTFSLKLELVPSFLSYSSVILQDKAFGISVSTSTSQSVGYIPIKSNPILKNSK